jgi:ribosomal protein L7/L12
MVEGLVAIVLQAVAASDAVLGIIFFIKGLQANSDATVQMPPDPPHAVLEKLQRSEPDLVNSLGSSSSEIVELIRQRRKIEAIKRIREIRRADLKEAKDLADRLESAMRS